MIPSAGGASGAGCRHSWHDWLDIRRTSLEELDTIACQPQNRSKFFCGAGNHCHAFWLRPRGHVWCCIYTMTYICTHLCPYVFIPVSLYLSILLLHSFYVLDVCCYDNNFPLGLITSAWPHVGRRAGNIVSTGDAYLCKSHYGEKVRIQSRRLEGGFNRHARQDFTEKDQSPVSTTRFSFLPLFTENQ